MDKNTKNSSSFINRDQKKESSSFEDESFSDKLNINKEIINNNKEKNYDVDEKFEEKAKNITKDIMNLEYYDIILKNNVKISKNNKTSLGQIKKNLILDSQEKPQNRNKNELYEDFDIINNRNKIIINIDDLQKGYQKENIEFKKKRKDDTNNLKMKKSNKNKNCEIKKLDETTKTTINNILENILNDMNTDKRIYKRKFSQRNKKLRINEKKKIEIIEEADKESSTSEICKEKRISDSNLSKKFYNDSLRESCKSKNFIEKNQKNEKKVDENEEFHDIDTKENIRIIEYKKSKSIENDINIRQRNKFIKKSGKKNNRENENKNNLKQNVIQININNNKNSDNKDIIENEDMNSSNNDNITISNSNSIIENNSLDIEYFELEYQNKNDKGITKKDIIIENKEIDIKAKSPKDNKITKSKINDIKLDNPPKNIIFKNVLNKNKINNININTINTKNIIIINNNIINKNAKSYINKLDIKSILQKEPQDRRKPKDNKNKKKNIEYKSKEESKNLNNKNILIKEAFLNSETKNRGIGLSNKNKRKKNELKKDDNLSRSFSGATQFNNLLKSEKKINYQKQINNKNIPDTKYKINNNENKLINIAQNKLIINNDTNSENHTKILKSKTNTNKTKTNFKKRIVKSKTHDYDDINKSEQKQKDNTLNELFNINEDCILY